MKTMTRDGAATEMSRRLGCPITTARRFLDMTFDVVGQALQEGQKVEFRNFGMFQVVHRKERVGRNPSDPQAGGIKIPARRSIKFKSSRNLDATLQ